MSPRRGQFTRSAGRRSADACPPPVPDALPRESEAAGAAPGRALLVSNDDDVLAFTAYCLASTGYQVTTAPSAAEAIASLQWSTYELVVLDAALRSISAIELLRRLRLPAAALGGAAQARNEDAAVLVLPSGSGGRSREDAERLAAFAFGADDVIPRDVSQVEFLLRGDAAVRRRRHHRPTRAAAAAAAVPAAEPLRFTSGDLHVDAAARQAWVAGEPVELTWMEFEILTALASQAGRLMTRAQLREAAGSGGGSAGRSRAIDVHVNRLRTRLGAAGSLIETVRRAGYRLRCRAPTSTPGPRGTATRVR